MIQIEKIEQTKSADLLVESKILSTVDSDHRIVNCCEHPKLGLIYIISDGAENDLLIREVNNV